MSENSQQTVYSSVSSFFLCIFCRFVSVCKAERTFVEYKKKKPTQTDAHILILSRFPCFCLVALQCHIEYGENIFLETNKAVKLYRSV